MSASKGVARVDVKLSVVVPAADAKYVEDWLYDGLTSQLRDYLDLGCRTRIRELVPKDAGVPACPTTQSSGELDQ